MKTYLILLLLLLFLFSASAGAADGQGWKFRSDLNNSGVYDDGGIRPGNELLWKTMTENFIGSTPAVVDGIVYICGYCDIKAIDAWTGVLLWTSPGGGYGSTPAVVDAVVYVVNCDGHLSAIDASNGALLWQQSGTGRLSPTPAVAGGVVYAGSFEDYRLYALDAGTGEVLWSYLTDNRIDSCPAVADGIVYIGSRDQNLSALDAQTGALLWKYATGSELLNSCPVVESGVVYIQSSDGTLSALDAASGDLLWTLPFSGLSYSCPAVAYGMVYTRSGEGTISAIDAVTADYVWNYTTSGPVPENPSVANGIVYFGNDDGILSALDAATGDLLWEYTTDETGFSSPVIANGVVYIQGRGTSYLYALATLPDDPPASVTGLYRTAINGAEITWAWADPAMIGFSHVMVYLDGVFQENVSAGIETWTATGLTPSTPYTIGIRTVGVKGPVNATLVTNTETTGTLSISHLDPAGVVEDDPAFTLTVYGTGFTPACTIHWNGGEQATRYLQPDQISMDVPAEYVAHSRRVTIAVHDPVSGESSNAVILPVTDNPATAMARKFRSDLTNTGVYDDGGRRPHPTLLWTFQAEAGTSSPSIVDGVVYIGSRDRNLYALDALTGTLLWQYDTGERGDWVSSCPTVANGVVYIGGMRHKIHALDAYSGDLLWTCRLPFRTSQRSSLSSSAAVADGIVYIGNMDGNLYAFREETGDLIWNFTTVRPGSRNFAIFSTPAVAGGVVYFQNMDGIVFAVDAITGDLLWTATISGTASSPSVGEGILYIGGAQGTLWALDVTTGAALWNFTAGGRWIESSPAIADGMVYYGSTDNNTYALNATTGALLWNFTTGGYIGSSPAVANGVVYIGSADTNIYALDASTGSLLWNYTTGGSVSSSPAVAHGIVYFGNSDGRVYAIGSLPGDPPVAAFSANVTSGDAPLDVLFTDTSRGIVTTRSWDFGDGTTAWANETVTVSHTYRFPGTFTVSLAAGNQDGEDTMTKPGYIQVSSSGTPPVAWFTASPRVGPEPLTVSFADQSRGSPTVWQWDFGDGNTSSEQNPGHTYAAAGKYTPTLTVAGSGGSSSYSSLVWVSGEVGFPTFTPAPTFTPKPTLPPQSGLAPRAFFVANTSFGYAPMTVQFTDWSFNAPENWHWDFGDGTTSVLQNPVTMFAEPGTYRVSLTVTNAYGESSLSRTVYVR